MVVGIIISRCILLLAMSAKLTCTLLCKTDSDCVSSVLQCKYARRVQDALAQVLKIFKKFGSLLKIIGVRDVT